MTVINIVPVKEIPSRSHMQVPDASEDSKVDMAGRRHLVLYFQSELARAAVI